MRESCSKTCYEVFVDIVIIGIKRKKRLKTILYELSECSPPTSLNLCKKIVFDTAKLFLSTNNNNNNIIDNKKIKTDKTENTIFIPLV